MLTVGHDLDPRLSVVWTPDPTGLAWPEGSGVQTRLSGRVVN